MMNWYEIVYNSFIPAAGDEQSPEKYVKHIIITLQSCQLAWMPIAPTAYNSRINCISLYRPAG
jgi:hypothetical protein